MSVRRLKKSLSGFEAEFCILDNNGIPIKNVDPIIKECRKELGRNRVKTECNKSWIELTSYPSINVNNTSADLLHTLEHVCEIAGKKDMYVFPFATHPMRYEPAMRKKRWYLIQQRVFGKDRFRKALLCAGFHYHYTLPRGIFDHKKGFLRVMKHSKIKESMMHSYNVAIAVDPILTSFLQSSPFVDGRNLAKDSRLLYYRGGKQLNYPKGMYGNQQLLGGLPPYKQTEKDLIYSIRKREKRVKKLIEKAGVNPGKTMEKTHTLDLCWNVVRINKLGTLELRGMDVNYPQYMIGAGILLKFLFREIQQDFLKVVPADITVEEAFKREGNVVYIPPHTTVRNILQRESAYNGFSSKKIRKYTTRFLRFIKPSLHKEYMPALKPLLSLIKKKKTVSDRIISSAKRKGFNLDSELSKKEAAEIALNWAYKTKKETIDYTELLEGLEL